jgi:hypothetical protein
MIEWIKPAIAHHSHHRHLGHLHPSTPHSTHANNIGRVHAVLLRLQQLTLSQGLCLGLRNIAKFSSVRHDIHHVPLLV